MNRFKIAWRKELRDKVELLAKTYNMSINKMTIRLIEMGYLEFIRSEMDEGKVL